jgi:hypothetical protein
MGAPALAYTQRRADASPLWALVSEYGEAVARVWEERFEAEYGPWRPHWRPVIEGFLECGDLACGFARVRCGDCGNEYLVPYSCTRKLCPSCEARRRLDWSDHVVEAVLPDLAYRQLVFTVPRVLRRTFLRERRVVVDAYAQESARADDGRDAGSSTTAAAEAERREWDWGA